MLRTLSYFQNLKLNSALEKLFKDLDVPVTLTGDAPASVVELLENNHKTDFDAYTGDAFLLGTVSDDAFEGISTKVPGLENIRGRKYDFILVFGIEIKRLNTEGKIVNPTRTQLFDLARAFNREFPDQPVVLVFRYCNHFISVAVCERLAYKRSDMQGDKIGKMSLLRDIDVREQKTHSGHLRILQDMSIQRSGKDAVNTYEELYAYWQKKLNVSVLNKRFYEELSNWYFWALHTVKFPNEPDGVDIEMLKTHRANNVIRLITRLIFTWFLKEKKLVSDTLFDIEGLTDCVNFQSLTPDEDNGRSIYYNAILQNLFFATLNQEMDKRRFKSDKTFQGRNEDYDNKTVYRHKAHFKSEQAAINLFKEIPFLNGGLFECLDQPLKSKTIDGFTDKTSEQAHVPNCLFFQKKPLIIEEINEDYGTKNKKYEVRGLINILNDYKFTVAENTPLEEEVALDPELLGRIFENLLASYNPETKTSARKQTGSFYTPREIVNYMVDESLMAYLKNEMLQSHTGAVKLGEQQVALFGEQTNKKGQFSLETQPNASRWKEREKELEQNLQILFETSETQPFTDTQDVQDLIRAIDTCKILDPACGSGAFPMGILHRMVNLLHKLDPNNHLWEERQLFNAESIEDPNARDEAIKAIKKAFEKNELDYGRKLFLIENCIYGVDIQPIAVQIAKLRFFISLICDQKADDKEGINDNKGVLALPNLETKFVAANTLIGLDNSNLAKMAVEELMKQREQLRHRIFSAKRYADKKRFREQDERIRQQIKDKLDTLGMGGQTEQLADWNPFDQNASAPFFDADWMFNIKSGFDVVIGNPPYILLQNLVISKEVAKNLNKYFVAQYKVDLYHLFIQKGIELMGKNGVLTYITPNTFLKNKHNDKLRQFIISNTSIKKFMLFYQQIFENAAVDTTVFSLQKGVKNCSTIDVAEIRNSFEIDKEFQVVKFPINLIKPTSYIFSFDKSDSDNSIIDLLSKNSKSIGEIGNAYFGIQTFDRESYVSKQKLSKTHFPVIDGTNVKKYFIGESIEFIDFRKENIKSGGNISVYSNDRIVVRQIGEYPTGSICPAFTYTLNTIYNISISNTSFLLKYVLSILNSKIVRFYWLKLFYDNKSTFPKIKKEPLESIPIKILPREKQLNFVQIVDFILFQKRTPSVSAAIGQYFEQVIDGMVCELYFTEEMTSKGIDIIGIVSQDLAGLPDFGPLSPEAKQAQIETLYRKWTSPASELNNRLSLMTVRSPDVLGVILGGK